MTDPEKTVIPEPLPLEALSWRCDDASFPHRTTSEVPAAEDIIGQERAVRAIQLGLEMKAPGYNLFLSGFIGTGRSTTIQHLLRRLDPSPIPPDDLIYIHNFADLDRPRALTLPAGEGRVLSDLMDQLLVQLHRELPKATESEGSRARRLKILDQHRAKQRDHIKAIEKKAAAEGFALIQVQIGAVTAPDIAPIVDGKPLSLPMLEDLVEAGQKPKADLDKAVEKARKLSAELQKTMRQVVKLEGDLATALQEHDSQAVRPLVENLVDDVRERFPSSPLLQEFLSEIESHVLANLERFVGPRVEADAMPSAEGIASAPEGGTREPRETALDLEFRVNVLVDNQNAMGAPVIVENSPSLARLFGMVERTWSPHGEARATHLQIKAGAMHRAHGGYLVLQANDLFSEAPQVWNTLKRTLRTSRLEIPGGESALALGPPTLKPEPFSIDVKAILIGDLSTYILLYDHDDDFQKTFKIRADFETEMPNTPEGVRQYAAFVERLRADEDTLSFDASGLKRLAEHGARLAGRKDRLSTRFHAVADVVRESSHYARLESSPVVGVAHVDRALDEREFRGRLGHEKLQEMVRDGFLLIDVSGKKCGQANGLSVYEMGEQVFGMPTKITATVGMGTSGIINIEREAEFSGRSHDKGMQILAGYLRWKYAQDKPLTLSASICFEQSYSGIDGDSASSTELYVLLSAISGLPLRQDLAITGSVNQYGEVQPIGDVNEKIEGYFDICSLLGLTGTQGVLIPHSNVTDLMLHPRVLDAARRGAFWIYAVRSIDEGISILTGLPGGQPHRRHGYERDTVNGKVDRRLRELATHMRDFGGHP